MATFSSFSDFYESLDKDQRLALAERADTSVAQLWQLATGRRNAGAALMSRLMSADNRITAAMLRPDLFGAAAA
jgi:hypothetical protein